MNKIYELETKRLKLRQWKESDYEAFYEMCKDKEVMKYFPKSLTKEESYEMANKCKTLISENGYGFWAVEEKESKQFIGFVGLHQPSYELPVKNCHEIGWRLAKKFWHKGYATEAANEALRFAFEQLKLNEVYSFTSLLNKPSISAMERIAMKNTNMNFSHPLVPKGNVLEEHCLYKITYDLWCKR